MEIIGLVVLVGRQAGSMRKFESGCCNSLSMPEMALLCPREWLRGVGLGGGKVARDCVLTTRYHSAMKRILYSLKTNLYTWGQAEREHGWSRAGRITRSNKLCRSVIY